MWETKHLTVIGVRLAPRMPRQDVVGFHFRDVEPLPTLGAKFCLALVSLASVVWRERPDIQVLLFPTQNVRIYSLFVGHVLVLHQRRDFGLAHDIGSVEAGKAADLCAWRVDKLLELGYWIGLPGPERRIFAGSDS